MRHKTFLHHAALLAAVLATSGAAGAATATPPQSFTPDYFAQFQASTAMDMVARLPGFVFDGGNASRGVAGNVLINGKRPTSKTEPLGDVLGRIPVAGVERIEVINGGAGGIDMQGYPTVANLLLKQMDLVSATTSVSSYLTPDGIQQPSLDGSYSLKHGDKSINVTLARNRSPDMSQGQGRRTTLYAAATPAAEVTIAGAGMAGNQTMKLSYGQDLLNGQLTWNSTVNPWTYQSQARYDAGTRSSSSNDNAGRTLEQGLAYTRDLANGASMDLKALHRTSEQTAESTFAAGGNPSYSVANATAGEQVVAGQLSWRVLDGVTIRGGFERTVNTNDNSNTYQANAGAAVSPTGSAWVQESRVEGQLSSAWQVDSSLSAEAGLKIEHSSLRVGADQPEAKAYVYPKPRLRLSLSPSSSLLLRLRMEREVSQLNFGDSAGYFGIADKTLRADLPDLVPAKTLLCEGAVEYRFGERGSAVLSYTQSHISDLLDRMPIRTANASYDAAGNIGDASADSVSGSLTLPTDSWSLPQGLLKLSMTRRSSSVTDPTTLETRALSGEQPLAWRVEFSQDLPRQRTAWGLSIDNGWSNDSWQVAEHDTSNGTGWARAFLNYRPASNLMVTLELNNLAGRVITNDRTHYAGDRLAGAIDVVEHNVTRTQPFAMLRVRRDW
ncbi:MULTISPECIES: hypothetical protein [unclassified Duganella]|uniref:hypothetical protein n=1 Tax=unclassified Duganella TaxID=2636909 RepID=UPI000E357579|nr:MULTISPECIES: hypothetical protein [unclassified Duganella]RFP13884.1 hypothetical protein D0T23_15955 [Duganella sp. BJB475]RFP36594.1 hypothetical protein D0T21_09315 [Duganella sp. BJB476]